MAKKKFNINRYIYVKLTDFGKEKIIEKCGYGYFEHCIEARKQPDGYYEMQAHAVMQLLGEYLYNGNVPEKFPFELNVYFDEGDLE